MYELILPPLTGLFGVVIGGFITYQSQANSDKRRFKHELKKRLDEEKRARLIAYSKIIKADTHSPLIHGAPLNQRNSFNWRVYESNVRDILYANLHLFDEKLIYLIIQIDGEKYQIDLVGDEHIYNEKMYTHYNLIISHILEELRNNYRTYIE
ncbi:hypothetical protein HMI01_10710 [Halolactibacillus miurensis]|uniref:Uncharacterized protein n=1 Tax=Halolactibacillus miurensis TaxID=306541 RepID=A0A1I6SID0_9BACI|nr:hypothetical protein [Halolactibacillus miurensis]GEM04083.1 hypothetical protein HMI01_10710 [Halolactibacillus miurensis]SFS76664.1 hypothetical protein SAMN05421668_10971 [Halolactibacillus miurensis]